MALAVSAAPFDPMGFLVASGDCSGRENLRHSQIRPLWRLPREYVTQTGSTLIRGYFSYSDDATDLNGGVVLSYF